MNKNVNWKYTCALEHEIIDGQHREHAVMFNKIVELSLTNGDQTDLQQRSKQLHELLNKFCAKTKEHFSVEEELMLKVNYPAHSEHARAHLMLMAELKRYIRHVEKGLDNIDISSLNSLKSWFISHISDSDKKFDKFLDEISQEEGGSSGSIGA